MDVLSQRTKTLTLTLTKTQLSVYVDAMKPRTFGQHVSTRAQRTQWEEENPLEQIVLGALHVSMKVSEVGPINLKS